MTPTIYKAEGSQIYTWNKMRFLKEKGWTVYVLSSLKNRNIIIDDLKIYDKSIIPELSFAPHLYTLAKRELILNKLIQLVNVENRKELIIESHTKQLAFWGELLASKIKCKHIVYLLSENFGRPAKYELDFFDFKHKRRELAGINKESLKFLFKDYKSLQQNEKYFLKALCSNSVLNIENSTINDINRLDINLGSIGRLDKSYVQVMIDEIVRFSKKRSDKQIQLILVGDSMDGKAEKEIVRKTRGIKNLHLIFTGHIFPIPSQLFNKVDIFIGVAGSAIVCANNRVPTIALDVRDSKPIGLLSYDTQNTIYSEQKSTTTLSEKLEEVIECYEHYKEFMKSVEIEIPDFRKEYENHMRFINESVSNNEYYDVIFNHISIEERVYKILLFLLGPEKFARVTRIKVLRKIRKILRSKLLR